MDTSAYFRSFGINFSSLFARSDAYVGERGERWDEGQGDSLPAHAASHSDLPISRQHSRGLSRARLFLIAVNSLSYAARISMSIVSPNLSDSYIKISFSVGRGNYIAADHCALPRSLIYITELREFAGCRSRRAHRVDIY